LARTNWGDGGVFALCLRRTLGVESDGVVDALAADDEAVLGFVGVVGEG
jgi:hypothetical protein